LIREDLEHKLLSGSAIYIDDCPTYKVTLQDMADHGFGKMQEVIALMASDDTTASKLLNNIDDTVSTFFVLMICVIQDLRQADNQEEKREATLYNSVLKFLSLFFRREVCFEPNAGFVVKDDSNNIVFVLNEGNYNQFRNVLKQRNCLADIDDIEDESPANEMVAKLLEKKRMFKEKLRKAHKAQDGEGISMADLISIFAEAEKMPLQDVYRNYDVYQFNNQFNRLKIMDDYHVNIQALIAGAKPEDVKLQHWISKIKKEEM
jgi:hypothetical protein